MDQPIFTVGQKVKFINDHDVLAGVVLGFSYDSENGYVYKISSKAYDPELNTMVDGVKTCKESELVEVVDTPKEEPEEDES